MKHNPLLCLNLYESLALYYLNFPFVLLNNSINEMRIKELFHSFLFLIAALNLLLIVKTFKNHYSS